MKKKLVSRLLSVLIICALVFSLGISSQALLFHEKVAGANEFTSSWKNKVQKYDSLGIVIGVLEYGFDKGLTKKDYAITKGQNNYKSCAAIQRGSETVQFGKIVQTGSLSEKRVTHTIDDVKYYIELTK